MLGAPHTNGDFPGAESRPGQLKIARAHSNTQPGLRIPGTERRHVGEELGLRKQRNLSQRGGRRSPRGRAVGCSLQPRLLRAGSLGQWLWRQAQGSRGR